MLLKGLASGVDETLLTYDFHEAQKAEFAHFF